MPLPFNTILAALTNRTSGFTSDCFNVSVPGFVPSTGTEDAAARELLDLGRDYGVILALSTIEACDFLLERLQDGPRTYRLGDLRWVPFETVGFCLCPASNGPPAVSRPVQEWPALDALQIVNVNGQMRLVSGTKSEFIAYTVHADGSLLVEWPEHAGVRGRVIPDAGVTWQDGTVLELKFWPSRPPDSALLKIAQSGQLTRQVQRAGLTNLFYQLQTGVERYAVACAAVALNNKSVYPDI